MKDSAKAALAHKLAESLESGGGRKTPERFAILDAACSMGGHFTIDELAARLSAENRFHVSRATLYNTLRLFVAMRLVVRHRFMGATRYEVCQGGGHCHQVCTVCGAVADVASPEVGAAVDGLRLQRFRKDGYSLYVYGVCSACQARLTRRKGVAAKKTKQQKTEQR